jgi:Arc/MetJ-type ribon-helix-helix transcriptional regulator
MVRTQVQLTEEQLEKLRRISAENGKSVAELVRLGVELYLSSNRKPDQRELRERALRAAGRFSSGAPNTVARDHDEHLAEIWKDW